MSKRRIFGLIQLVLVMLLVQSITFIAFGDVQVNMGELKEGNTNPEVDQTVDGLDFSDLKSTFLKDPGDPLFNPMADFNRDGAVDGLDFSSLKANFLKGSPLVLYDLMIMSSGNGTTTPSGTSVQTSTYTVDINANPDGGYGFDVWTGDTEYLDSAADMAANSVTYTGGESITITLQANFVAD